MPPLTQDDVLNALREVMDHAKKKDVVSLGMIQGISIKDGHVSFTLEVDPAEGRQKEPLRQESE